MPTKFTAQHFPKGTVIQTSLYIANDQSFTVAWFGTDNPATFTVDHIRVVDTINGVIYLLVTTTKKSDPLAKGDDFITFNIDHVDRIVKLGTVSDIRYSKPSKKWDLDKSPKNTYRYEFAFKMHLLNMFNVLQPQNQYNLDKAFSALVRRSLVKIKNEFNGFYNQRTIFVCNKRKLNAWVKRNINRYILTQKEIAQYVQLVQLTDAQWIYSPDDSRNNPEPEPAEDELGDPLFEVDSGVGHSYYP